MHEARLMHVAHAISKATRCEQNLFSVSLNPPEHVVVSDDVFREAATRVAVKLGLNNQPCAIVVHEKKGRHHSHVVFSRIDGDEMKAINLSHYKLKMREIARDLHLDHGWELPNGLKSYGQGNPLNFTLDQWQ
ncbi:relaxase/mobilization nuclease domain-containing protein [Marivita hallyeonensis]|uniref:relaxase/mobilization nuclease domain-containing protein n=1 Tax=Marivita hallyeonensis TaxID=996342 RepID=UPI000A00E7DF|nr:relaxase/mobilization nuclease domain-containing protein [Marivita hallyeonensis]